MSKYFLLRKRIAAALVAVAMLAALPLSGCSNDDSKEESKTSTSETSTDAGKTSGTESKASSDENSGAESKASSEVKENSQNSGSQNSSETSPGDKKTEKDVVVKSKNYSVTFPVMQYLFNYMFQNFCNNYGTSFIDTSKDIKSQYYNEEEKISWYDYFLTNTKNYLQQIMVFAEGGKEQNITLSEADEESISSGFDQLESYAEQLGMTAEEYIKKEYGDTVTKDDIEQVQRMTLLAQQYNNFMYDSFLYKNDDYEAEYNKNKSSYSVADYLVYSFTYNSDTSQEEKAELKKQADELAKMKTKEEFQNFVTKYLKDNPSRVTVSSSETSLTEAAFNSAIDATVQATETVNGEYNDSNESYKWVFSDERKAGDSIVTDENRAYNAILVTNPIHRDDRVTRNVRHILIMVGDNEKADQYKETAEAILDEWRDGKADEESFAKLARDYTEDTGSKNTGGLYKGVMQGQMVAEFNDWLFDEKRKTGDTGIVRTTYGYHIMYYPGVEMPKWQFDADAAMRQNDMSETYKALAEKYTIEFDDDAIKNMTLKMPETQTSDSE